jgi:two-component system chemotaxis sensor kinase CheA
VITDPLLQSFFDEAAELLADCEAALLDLEVAPTDRGLLDRVFRCAHTLKSNSGLLGFEEVMRYTHALEDLLELLRTGARPVTPAVIDTLLGSQDVVRGLLARARADERQATPEEAGAVLRSLEAIRALVQAPPPDAGPAAPAPEISVSAPGPAAPQPAEAAAEPAPAASPDQPPAVAEDAGPHRRRASDRDDVTSIRVQIDRVDRLINLVGELVITQSIVSQTVTNFTPDKLAELREAVT